MMKIFFSPASPFVRKVLIVAHELGFADRIEKLPSAAHAIDRDRTILEHNPLAQVPTFFADDGTVLYDSRVICEYLDAMDGRGRFFPSHGAARWRALCDQSLGDGLMNAALLARAETVLRSPEQRSAPWLAGQLDKIETCLDAIEPEADGYRQRLDIGTVSIACGLGYLDLRFAGHGWRGGRPRTARWFAELGARSSMASTLPRAAS